MGTSHRGKPIKLIFVLLFSLLLVAPAWAEVQDGDCYCNDDGIWVDPTASVGVAGDSLLSFSNASDTNQTATFFLTLNGSAATSGIIAQPMTCTAMYVRIGTASGTNGSWTVAAQKNVVATPITCPLANATTCNDTAHSFSAVAGDRIRFAFTETGTAAGTGNASVGLLCNSD